MALYPHIFSAPDVGAAPPAEQQAIDQRSWQQLVQHTVLPFGIDVPEGSEFSGRINATGLLDTSIFEMTSGMHGGERTAADVDQVPEAQVILSVQLSGHFRLIQSDRNATIRPGQFIMYTSDVPVQIEGSRNYRSIGVKIPLARFRDPAHVLHELSATVFDANRGLAPAVWTFIERLVAGGPGISRDSRAGMSHHVVGMIEQLLREQTPRQGQLETSTAALRENCLRYIESHLQDPELSPDQIATAAFISTRYLHQLFSGTGTTVSRHVRQRRLERVREDLADPQSAGLPIEQILQRWGVNNVSHFGQVFKKIEGCTPAEYRRHVLG